MTIRHDCQTGGCYIKRQTPDWGFLDSSFSGRIRVTDIDGAVEVNGHLLLLEWKGEGVPLLRGQEIMFQQITKANNITVFLVHGDPVESKPTELAVYWNGIAGKLEKCDKDKLQQRCRDWENHARGAVAA